jgi:hypothetical protein
MPPTPPPPTTPSPRRGHLRSPAHTAFLGALDISLVPLDPPKPLDVPPITPPPQPEAIVPPEIPKPQTPPPTPPLPPKVAPLKESKGKVEAVALEKKAAEDALKAAEEKEEELRKKFEEFQENFLKSPPVVKKKGKAVDPVELMQADVRYSDLNGQLALLTAKSIKRKQELKAKQEEEARQEVEHGKVVDVIGRGKLTPEQKATVEALERSSNAKKEKAKSVVEGAQQTDDELKRLKNLEIRSAELEEIDRRIKRLTPVIEQLHEDADQRAVTAKAKKAKKDAKERLPGLESEMLQLKEDKKLAERLKTGLVKEISTKSSGRTVTAMEAQNDLARLNKAEFDQEAAELDDHKAIALVEAAQKRRADLEKSFDSALGNEVKQKLAVNETKRETAFKGMRDSQQSIETMNLLAMSDPTVALKESKERAARARTAADNAKQEHEAFKKQYDALTPEEKLKNDKALAALKENADSASLQADDEAAASLLVQQAHDKLDAKGVVKIKEEQSKLEEDRNKIKADWKEANAALKKLDTKGEWNELRKAPQPLSKADSKKLEKLLKDKKLKGAAEKVLGLEDQYRETQKQQKEKEAALATALGEATKDDQAALTQFKDTAKDADHAAEKIKADAIAEKHLEGQAAEIEEAKEIEVRATVQKIDAEAAKDAAERNAVQAEFLKGISENKKKNKDIFAKFDKLNDASFDDVFEKHDPGWTSQIQTLSTMPDPNDPSKKIPNPEFEKDVIATREAYVELIQQDQILEDMGASLEDRKRAFEGVPKALWPPKFREELKAYREVSLLFAEEDEHERKEQAARELVKESLMKKLGKKWEAAEPIITAFFDAMGSVADIVGYQLASNSGAKPEFKGGVQWEMSDSNIPSDLKAHKENLEMVSMIGDGLDAYLKRPKEMVGDELDALEGLDDEEKGGGDKTLDVLTFLKTFIKTSASATKMTMSIAKKVATEGSTAQKELSGAIPIVDILVNALETAEAVYKSGKAIKMAATESSLKSAVDAEDDEIMQKAFSNASGRSTEIAVKRTVDATAKGLQLGGSASGGSATPWGLGLKVGGKGVEYANKAAFQVIDWVAAAKANETLMKAAAGSHKAMQEVFADHQKFATMYIAVRARDGDNNCLKMCVGRGVDKGQLLDSGTSLKIIRQLMLKTVDQEDHMNTFGESKAEAWDKLCKTGKFIKGIFTKEEEVAPTPPPVHQPIETPSALPSPTEVEVLLDKARKLDASFQMDSSAYSEKDVIFRDTALNVAKSARKLIDEKKTGNWNKDGKMEPPINELYRILVTLPDKPNKQVIKPLAKTFTPAEERLRRTR